MKIHEYEWVVSALAMVFAVSCLVALACFLVGCAAMPAVRIYPPIPVNSSINHGIPRVTPVGQR